MPVRICSCPLITGGLLTNCCPKFVGDFCFEKPPPGDSERQNSPTFLSCVFHRNINGHHVPSESKPIIGYPNDLTISCALSETILSANGTSSSRIILFLASSSSGGSSDI